VKGLEDLLQAPAEASCVVMPKGAKGAALVGAVAGELGGSLGRAAIDTVAGHRNDGASPLRPGSWSLGALALTRDEVVLVEGKRALIGTKATGVVARAPRARVEADLGKGKLTAPLVLRWASGVTWELEVPRAELGRARELSGALAG
jgi:hypothetical protein